MEPLATLPSAPDHAVEALTRLMEQKRPALLRLAMRKSQSREDAEDALQDAYLSAYRHLGQFEGRAQLGSWLTRIVLNAAADRMRHHLAHPSTPITTGASAASRVEGDEAPSVELILVDAAPNPEQLAATDERWQMLARLMRQLPAGWSRALHLRALEGLSTRETARRLGVAEGTVKSHLYRAHRKLRSELGVREAQHQTFVPVA